jgi:hypothetical protein
MPSAGMRRRVALLETSKFLVTTNDVSSSLVLFVLIMEEIYSTETSVLTNATDCHIPEDGCLHSHCLENLKFYIALTGWAICSGNVLCLL